MGFSGIQHKLLADAHTLAAISPQKCHLLPKQMEMSGLLKYENFFFLRLRHHKVTMLVQK
jgi:hypothetical protein